MSRSKRIHRLVMSLLVAVSSELFLPLEQTTTLAPIVTTVDGDVQGHMLSDGVTVAYQGIPFAAPPVGELRWQPPASVVPWMPALLPGSMPGPPCVGKPTPGVLAGAMSEDCLYLDVYAPVSAAGVPVTVFLHGGSLVEGSSTSIQSGYGAVGGVAQLNVLSVAVNYRLAVAGFLALEALAARDVRGVAGNYGLLDCIAALRWLKANAAAFGGDAERVTVHGQSSGGSLVFALMASPLAGGLLQTGYSMSGSPRLSATLQEAGRLHQEAVRQTRCASLLREDNATLTRCLHSLNVSELTAAMPSDWDAAGWSFDVFSTDYFYGPVLVVDGTSLVPGDYLTTYRDPPAGSPLAQGATLVIGVTREEVDFAPSDDVRTWSLPQFRDFVTKKLSNDRFPVSFAEDVLSAYNLQEHDEMGDDALDIQRLYAQIISDATIYCPNLVLADARAAGASLDKKTPSGKLYVYSTSQTPGQAGGFCPLKPFQAVRGYCPRYAFHATDMYGLFKPNWTQISLTTALPDYVYTTTDLDYQELMSERFKELASTKAVLAWTEYVASSGYSVVDLAAPGEANVANLRETQCAVWRPYYSTLGLIN